MNGRYQNAASRAGQAASYIRPEIMAIPAATMKKFLAAKELAPHRVVAWSGCCATSRTRWRKKEEKLLAMQAEMAETANQIFRQLTDADLKFGLVRNEKGEQVELSNASFSLFLHSPKRSRAQGSVSSVLRAVRGPRKHAGRHARRLGPARRLLRQGPRATKCAGRRAVSRQRAASVYDNLIAAVHSNLPALYRYYDLRRRKMKLQDIHHYDTYVPILSELETRHTWDQAVKVVVDVARAAGQRILRRARKRA